MGERVRFLVQLKNGQKFCLAPSSKELDGEFKRFLDQVYFLLVIPIHDRETWEKRVRRISGLRERDAKSLEAFLYNLLDGPVRRIVKKI
jgi:hypothetical protein